MIPWISAANPPREDQTVFCYWQQPIEIEETNTVRLVNFWLAFYDRQQWHTIDGATASPPLAWASLEEITKPGEAGLTIAIIIKERRGQGEGPARKVDIRVRANGHATQAEEEYAQHFRPLIEQMLGTPMIDRSQDHGRHS